MPKTIEISHRTVIFTVIFLGVVWLLVKISSIILGLFVSILLMTALNPLVYRLVRFKIPRVLAILIVYVLLLSAIGWGLAGIFPPLIEQTSNFVDKLPNLLSRASLWLSTLGIKNIDPDVFTGQISQLGSLPANIVSFVISVFSNIIAIFTVLVVTFYMLLERDRLNRYLTILFGDIKEKKAKDLVDKLESRLGGWVRGELILMTIIGLLTYVGLFLLGIPYALPLAILAGILEIVPGIGPIVSSIPAILLGLTVSPVMSLAVAALYFLVQQLENNLIVPNVMKRTAGVNPLVTMISIAIGLKLAGVLGAILAVPIIIVAHVFLTEYFSLSRS